MSGEGENELTSEVEDIPPIESDDSSAGAPPYEAIAASKRALEVALQLKNTADVRALLSRTAAAQRTDKKEAA